MKKYIKYIGAILVALQCVSAKAQVTSTPLHTNDSVLVYTTWERIYNDDPDTLLINPNVKINSPYEFEITPSDPNNKSLKNYIRHGALALYDVKGNTWLVNSNRLKDEFKGDAKKLDEYVPLYFSAKIAFVQYKDFSPSLGGMFMHYLIYGIDGIDVSDYDYYDEPADIYLIDFAAGEVKRVDHKKLIKLLEPYNDLLRRFTTMKNYKETYMVNDYFLEYVNRLNDDPTVPYLFWDGPMEEPLEDEYDY